MVEHNQAIRRLNLFNPHQFYHLFNINLHYIFNLNLKTVTLSLSYIVFHNDSRGENTCFGITTKILMKQFWGISFSDLTYLAPALNY